MKAGIYYGKQDVRIEEIPIPEIKENDVLIKNIYSGICGTDIAVYINGSNTGHKIEVGGEFGHETVSEIVKVGNKVTDFKIGDIVYPYPRFAKGDTKKAGVIGGFSEYILIPNAKKNYSLYFVPKQIKTKVAGLTEPFTVGCRAARRAAPRIGENAVVFGCGTIGIATAISLKYFGCDKVMICDLSDFRLTIARELGFDTCNVKSEIFYEKAIKIFGTADGLGGKISPNADIFIDAAGNDLVLNNFFDYGKLGSRIVLVAVNKALRPLDLLHLTYAQKSVIGSGGYMPEDVKDVFEIMKSHKWNIEKIITHEFKLEELSKAISTAADYDNSFNVVINFGKDN